MGVFYVDRQDFSAQALTGVFQNGQNFATSAASFLIRRWDKVAYAIDYFGGAANVGRAEVRIQWRVSGGAGFFTPAVGGTILLPAADGTGDAEFVIGAENPGGMAEVRFSIREVGDVANPGSVSSFFRGRFTT